MGGRGRENLRSWTRSVASASCIAGVSLMLWGAVSPRTAPLAIAAGTDPGCTPDAAGPGVVVVCLHEDQEGTTAAGFSGHSCDQVDGRDPSLDYFIFVLPDSGDKGRGFTTPLPTVTLDSGTATVFFSTKAKFFYASAPAGAVLEEASAHADNGTGTPTGGEAQVFNLTHTCPADVTSSSSSSSSPSTTSSSSTSSSTSTTSTSSSTSSTKSTTSSSSSTTSSPSTTSSSSSTTSSKSTTSSSSSTTSSESTTSSSSSTTSSKSTTSSSSSTESTASTTTGSQSASSTESTSSSSSTTSPSTTVTGSVSALTTSPSTTSSATATGSVAGITTPATGAGMDPFRFVFGLVLLLGGLSVIGVSRRR